MGWKNGKFTRTDGVFSGALVWTQNQDANVGIESARLDTHDQDIAGGINQLFNKDGTSQASGNIPMGGFVAENLGTPTQNGDIASVGYAEAFLDTDPSLADQSMGNRRITNLGAPGASDLARKQDAAGVGDDSFGYVDDDGTLIFGEGVTVAKINSSLFELTFDNAANSTDEQVVLLGLDGTNKNDIGYKNLRADPISASVVRVRYTRTRDSGTSATVPPFFFKRNI